jgi:hemerythrin-like domain-containing protein
MQARGLLMMEHRLIERLINILKNTLTQIESTQEVDPVYIDTVVDFLHMYVDRTHHGKEEDILFRNLKKRSLSLEERRVMEKLIEEHVLSRQTTQGLAEANSHYRKGDESALKEIVAKLFALVLLYLDHIEKEDKVFFPASRAYFTNEEDQSMLAEFWEFDRRMIHDKYREVVDRLEGK